MMTPKQAIKLLNALADMVEDWDDPDEYLEALDMGTDALRSFPTDEFAL